MNRRNFIQAASASALAAKAGWAQDGADAQRRRWMRKAEALKPTLVETVKTPLGIVRPVSDPGSFLRWKVEQVGPAATLGAQQMRAGDSVVLDFGAHLTGHLSFSLAGAGRGVDAPARIKLIFGEVPAEVAEPFDPYQGFLSRAWLQDETINMDALPAWSKSPRQLRRNCYACRQTGARQTTGGKF